MSANRACIRLTSGNADVLIGTIGLCGRGVNISDLTNLMRVMEPASSNLMVVAGGLDRTSSLEWLGGDGLLNRKFLVFYRDGCLFKIGI